MIVDAHLDIAWNALAHGRGFEGPPAPGYLVSRESLTRAGVGLVFATLYCAPGAGVGKRLGGSFSYETAKEANLMARAQLNYYAATDLDRLTSRSELEAYISGWRKGRLASVILMEGADPIESPAQVGAWARAGVRIVGPAWARTRYCGGTHAPGGLTELGFRLLKAMRTHSLILDLSHLAEESVHDAFGVWRGPIMASHSNARELGPGDRQVSAATVAEVGRRGGMVGVSFYGGHLGQRVTATLDHVVEQVLHHARSAGSSEHVGLGTDADGGFDAAASPIRDLSELRELPRKLRRHFSAVQVEGLMGQNWIEFLRRSLPPT